MSKLKNKEENSLLDKTQKLLNLCLHQENVNSQNIEILLEALHLFFTNYYDCMLPSVVWELTDKITILEATAEEKKVVDVDKKTLIYFCEYTFQKIIEYSNSKWTNFVELFSFSCLKRHLCSLISTLIQFSKKEIRRNVEASFTKELNSIIRKMLENVKAEKDLEIKKYYVEFLWRAFRRVDSNFIDKQKFQVKKKTIENLQNLEMLKFDETCINWLKEEHCIDTKMCVDKGEFKVIANKIPMTRSFFLCYIGICSIIIYFNSEEDETCKMEIPYYHVTSMNYENRNHLDMECKTIVEQTNIFALWGEGAQKMLAHGTVSKFSVSLFMKLSNEIVTELTSVLKKIHKNTSVEEPIKEETKLIKDIYRKEEETRQNVLANKEKIIESKNQASKFKDVLKLDCALDYKSDSTSNKSSPKEKPYVSSTSNVKKEDANTIKFTGKSMIRSKTRKRIDSLKHTEKKKKYAEVTPKKKETHLIQLKREDGFGKNIKDNVLLDDSDFKINFNMPEPSLFVRNFIEKSNDGEQTLEQFLLSHSKQKDKFKKLVHANFSKAFTEIDKRINCLVEKEKQRRYEVTQKLEKKRDYIVAEFEKDLTKYKKEIKTIIEKLKNIKLNKSDLDEIEEEKKLVVSAEEILIQNKALETKVKESLEKMDNKIKNIYKEYDNQKEKLHKYVDKLFK